MMLISKLVRLVLRRRITLGVCLLLILSWEILAHGSPHPPGQESPLVPPFGFVFAKGLLGMSNYWHLNIIAPSPLRGGDETYMGGLLAIIYHTFISVYRLVLGLVFGFMGGVFVGLVISSVEFFNRILSLTINIIRICPLLAMTPLFQFWFGTNEIGVIVFIAYGVGVIFLVGTLNAVKNIPNHYINYSKMLGATGYTTLVKVVLPSILPELFSSIYLALGVAWSALISAEYIGVESGLGRIIIWSDYFTQTARMTLAALVILSLSFISILVVGKISTFALRWMPGVKSQETA